MSRIDDYRAGYRDGYEDAMRRMPRPRHMVEGTTPKLSGREFAEHFSEPPRKKRKKSKKVQILDNLAAKAWKKYKKGSGKKTYIEIRAQVSRSRDYKKKVKNL